MLESLQRVLFYVQAYEKQFVQDRLEKSSEEQKKELAKKRSELSNSEKRIAELDILFQHIYEDNISGKLRDERFETMSANYEAEQENLKRAYTILNADVEVQDSKATSVSDFVERSSVIAKLRSLYLPLSVSLLTTFWCQRSKSLTRKSGHPLSSLEALSQ